MAERLAGQVMANRVPGSLVFRVDGKKHSFNLKTTNLSHLVHHLRAGLCGDIGNSVSSDMLGLLVPGKKSHCRGGPLFLPERFQEDDE